MKAAFAEYLEKVGIAEPIQERIKTIYEFFAEVCPEEITGIFISDYIKEDGTREYTHLHFLSEKYSMLAVNFINEDDFRWGQFVPVRNIRIRKRDYDFKEANEESRMTIDVIYVNGGHSEYQASKANCDYLKNVFQKYHFPAVK